jgi:membrane peptidoglycan carboxypeptidase
MTYSYNTPAVRVVDKIGPSTVISYARKMGIMSPLQPYVPIALGSDAVSPLEMAAAYSIFPNYGNRAEPMSIIRVVNHQREVLEENRPSVREAVISETTVRQISSILADVVSHGTAASAAGIHEVPGAHGKTGTTNDNRDAWFVGYTPELSTAVWVSGAKYFHKGNKVTAVYPPMSGVTGGHVCAPIWARFMKTAIAIQRKSGEPIPPAPQKVKPAPDTDVAAAAAPAERRRAMWEPAFAASGDDAAESATRRRSYDRRRGDDGDAAGTLALAASSEAASAPAAPPFPAAATGTERRSSGGATEVLAMPAVAAPAAVPAARARQTPAPFAAAAEPLPPPRESAVVAPRRAPEEAPPAPREVSATICPDSGLRATRWCPESVTRTFTAGRGPRRSCRVHRPRPGDG